MPILRQRFDYQTPAEFQINIFLLSEYLSQLHYKIRKNT